LKATTSATCGMSTSSVDSTRSLPTTLRALVYTTTPGPFAVSGLRGQATSLRTILLQDPALAATNGSQAAQGVKDSRSGLSRDHVLLHPAYTATNGSTAVSGHVP
jgi:hypothetical protein